MKIHHVLFNEFHGRDVMETLCGPIIHVVRKEGMVSSFVTDRARTPIQCVGDSRDVTCSTCKYVWRNIKGVVRG